MCLLKQSDRIAKTKMSGVAGYRMEDMCQSLWHRQSSGKCFCRSSDSQKRETEAPQVETPA